MTTCGFEHPVAVTKSRLERPHRHQLRIDSSISKQGWSCKLKHEATHISTLFWATTKASYVLSLLWLLLACPRTKHKLPFSRGKRKAHRTTRALHHTIAATYCKDSLTQKDARAHQNETRLYLSGLLDCSLCDSLPRDTAPWFTHSTQVLCYEEQTSSL